jgi:DNA-binding ferritin-like protein (Dps family)
MNFWETITGSDLTREWKAFEARAEALPADYRAAWEQIKAHLSHYSGFTGRNLIADHRRCPGAAGRDGGGWAERSRGAG